MPPQPSVTTRRRLLGALATSGLIGMLAGPTAAQEVASPEAVAEDGALQIELNGVESMAGGGCRMVFVLNNRTEVSIADMTYEVGLFDADGRVTGGLLIMPFGAIDAGRMRVVLFELTDRECSDMSMVLLNGVESCTDGAGLPAAVCEESVAVRSLSPSVTLRY